MMEQRPLDFDAPRARTTDPLASHAAADAAEASGLIGRQCAAVLELVRRTPGLTSAELSARHRMDRYVIARRLPDLERRGLVKRYEYGARAVRWEATP
jgi:DNA-binding MarR family transcriptional regulator